MTMSSILDVLIHFKIADLVKKTATVHSADLKLTQNTTLANGSREKEIDRTHVTEKILLSSDSS